MLVDWHWCSCWLVRGIERAHRLPAKATCPAPPVLTHHLGNHCPNISKLPKYLKIAQISQNCPNICKIPNISIFWQILPCSKYLPYPTNHCPGRLSGQPLPKYSKYLKIAQIFKNTKSGPLQGYALPPSSSSPFFRKTSTPPKAPPCRVQKPSLLLSS